MEIIVNDPTYYGDHGDFEACRRDLLADLREIHEEVILSEDTLGRGADWPVFFAVFSALTSLLVLGEKLEKGLDAWISMGKRLKHFLDAKRRKYGSIRLDPEAALLQVVLRVQEQEKQLRSLELVAHHRFPIHPLSWKPDDSLAQNHDAVYVFAVRANDRVMHLVTIKSTGHVLSHHRFNQSDWVAFLNEEREEALVQLATPDDPNE